MTTPIPVSWTQINEARQCAHKHWLRYHEGWRYPKVARPLAIGILWHEIMDAHYRPTTEGEPPGIETARDLLVEAGANNPNHPNHDIASTCLWMYDGYRRRWGMREDWTVHEVEQQFEVPLGSIEGLEFNLFLRIDMLVEMNRRLWIVDHKANKTIPKFDKELDLDDQMPLYIWAMRQLGYDIRGAIFNSAKTQQLKRAMSLDERFDRIWAYRSDYELETVVREALETLVDRYRSAAVHPRSPDPMNCKWRCPYVEACIAGRKAKHLETELLVAEGFTKREEQPVNIST